MILIRVSLILAGLAVSITDAFAPTISRGGRCFRTQHHIIVFSESRHHAGDHDVATFCTRRRVLQQVISTTAIVGSLLNSPPPAEAFDNKISSKYDDRPKRRGPKPPDLGVLTNRLTIDGDSYTGLKVCGPAPNCFSSTIPVDEDPDHSIPAWVWPRDRTQESALQELREVLLAYEPGQSNIDGGGFQIQQFDTTKGYAYVQFESLKNGFIDDVEFAVIQNSGNELQLRSSSRIGYLDYGVNAKRINYIAKQLRDRGWNAVGVDPATHKGYFLENQI